MNIKRFRQIRVVIAFFIGVVVAIAAVRDSYLLAIVGALIGMGFMILVRSKTKITIDERERTVREKAAQMTYAIFTPLLGIGALVLTFIPKDVSGDLQTLGAVFSYLTLLLIGLYSIAFYFMNRKYTGSTDEE